MLSDVGTRQHLSHPVQFGAGIHPGIFTLTKCWVHHLFLVDAVELKQYARRYLPYSVMKRLKQGEKSKRESSPWVKKKRKKKPGLKKRTIKSRSQRKFGSLLARRARGVTSRNCYWLLRTPARQEKKSVQAVQKSTALDQCKARRRIGSLIPLRRNQSWSLTVFDRLNINIKWTVALCFVQLFV